MSKTVNYLLAHPRLVRLINAFAPVFGALLAMWLLYNVETRLMPVITDFSITTLKRQGSNFVLSGHMTKTRPCELLHVQVVAYEKDARAPGHIIYRLGADAVIGGNAPAGRVFWGPVTLTIPELLSAQRDKLSALRIVGTHRCHAFWVQETEYMILPATSLPL